MDDSNNNPAPDIPDLPDLDDLPSALERLGASPFPKSGFSLLGFLATVYDQVTQTAKE